MSSENTTHKFIVALNKTLDPGVAMNAAAHMSLAMANLASAEERAAMRFIDYLDGDGDSHRSISALSLIVMRGKAGELKKLRANARTMGLLVVDFLESMTGDTYVEQLKRTRETNGDAAHYYGVAVFGPKEKVDALTKRLSVWTFGASTQSESE